MIKARVQEIMTGAYDQDGLANFYCAVFGMKIVWRRTPAPNGSLRGLFLSDGCMCLCIQQAGKRGGQSRPEGLQGIGLAIDDLEDVDRLAVRYGAPGGFTPRPHPDGEGFVDAEVPDPIGIMINLTKRGFGVAPLENVARRPPGVDPWTLPDVASGIRSMAFEAADAASMCRFYRNVFHLEVTQIVRKERASTCSLTDGRTALSFGPLSPNNDGRMPGRMAGFGFVVASAQETLRRAATAGARDVSPGEGGSGRDAGAYIVDPVGVRVDVSERA